MANKKGNYIDGFVLAVSKRNLAAYRKLARLAGKVWLEHGALEYWECAGDDLPQKGDFTFPSMVKLKTSELVFFSYIVYKSKTERNRILKKVMKDPRLAKMCDPKNPPFDMKRMAYGGFKPVVKL